MNTPSIIKALACSAGLKLVSPAKLTGFEGKKVGKRTGNALEFAEYRDYQPGDDIRRLDWGVFARQEQLMVRQFNEEVEPRCDIILDCSASMARTYDIEIQIPSMNGYKEVSSVSNARDYQARRGMIRFKRDGGGKPEFVHTLNGSGLATSRILPALVEQKQRADGSVVVPEVLRKYIGIEVIEPAK